MRSLLLINPNSSAATTDMMVGIAAVELQDGLRMVGATATRSPAMITSEATLAAAAAEVVEIGMREAGHHAGIIVGAFGDPGLRALRERVLVPVTGLCEASMLEAAAIGRFGVATVTPELAASITASAHALGLQDRFTGVRLTPGDPLALVKDPAKLQDALAGAVQDCLRSDGAAAVIIGGGPLGQVAMALQPLFAEPIIAPIPAAARLLLSRLN